MANLALQERVQSDGKRRMVFQFQQGLDDLATLGTQGAQITREPQAAARALPVDFRPAREFLCLIRIGQAPARNREARNRRSTRAAAGDRQKEG